MRVECWKDAVAHDGHLAPGLRRFNTRCGHDDCGADHSRTNDGGADHRSTNNRSTDDGGADDESPDDSRADESPDDGGADDQSPDDCSTRYDEGANTGTTEQPERASDQPAHRPSGDDGEPSTDDDDRSDGGAKLERRAAVRAVRYRCCSGTAFRICAAVVCCKPDDAHVRLFVGTAMAT